MSVRHLDDLVAFQFAIEFRDAVYALLAASPGAMRDLSFLAQVRDSTDGVPSNVAEGFHRFLPSEGAHFLRYALASLSEAIVRVGNGVGRGYYSRDACRPVFVWEARCRHATRAFRNSLLRNAERDRDARRNRTKPLRDERPRQAPAKRRDAPRRHRERGKGGPDKPNGWGGSDEGI